MWRMTSAALLVAFALLLGLSARGEAANARTTVSPSSPFLITRTGSTYRAESPSSGHIYTGTLKFVGESAALDLNVTGGGSLIFSAGVFDFGSEFFKFYDLVNITFQGQGIDVTFLQNSSSASADTEPFNMTNPAGVTVKDMTISAGGPARTTSDAMDFDIGNNSVIERVKITASRGRGIVFDGKDAGANAAGNTVRDCVVDGVADNGIHFLASSSNLVERCTITNVGRHGIQAAKASASAPQPNKKSNDNVIRDNIIDNSGQDGINVTSGDRNRIEGNRITNSANAVTADGIRLNSTNSITCDDNVIAGNISTDNQATKTQRYGLHISSALCNRTVVEYTNDFSGNRVAPIRDLGTSTQYTTAPDLTPPTVPGNVTATAISHVQIDVAWTASTDDVGISHYTIRRNGSVLATAPGGATGFSDTTVFPSTTYFYTVEAVDTSNKVSGQSSPPASATTPATPPSFTVSPEADSYVNESSPTTNYGSSTSLRTDASPINRSYLRFTVQGAGTVASVKLRVFANTGSTIGFDVRGVSDITWGESTINYSNAPAVGNVIRSSGSFTAGTWRELDVTPYIAGNGTYTLALTTPSSTAISYASREAAGTANDPHLLVTTGSPDNQPPTVPGNMTATAISHAQIDLSWTGSTDNVGVDHYTIRRGGLFLAQVSGATTSYSDMTVLPSTTYSYTVEAVDAATNPSGQSSPPASATTHPAPAGSTFTPVADAYVNESSPNTTYGAATSLRADATPVNRSYLRFTVSGLGGAVASAKLRVYANSASSVGHDIRGVTDITWGESTINYSNSPVVGSVLGSSGPITAGTWVEVDVTSYITGNGTYTLGLTTPSSTAISYASRESTNDPQLVITT